MRGAATNYSSPSTGSSFGISAIDDWFGHLQRAPTAIVWTSALKRAKSDHTPHWLFKSPVAMLSANRSAPCLALVPDLSAATNASLHSAPLALDARNSAKSNPNPNPKP